MNFNPGAHEAVTAKITELYTPMAQDVASTVIANDYPVGGIACVVTGPWRSGKSQFLLPEVQRILDEDGVGMCVVDCQAFFDNPEQSFSSRIENVTPSEKTVLVLDEAGYEGVRGHESEILDYFRSHGFNTFIPVIAHHIKVDSQTAIIEVISGWRNATPPHTKDIPHFALPPRILSPELATELMASKGNSPQVIAHALGKLGAALYLPAVDYVSYLLPEFDHQYFDHQLAANAQTWTGAIPEEDRRRLANQ